LKVKAIVALIITIVIWILGDVLICKGTPFYYGNFVSDSFLGVALLAQALIQACLAAYTVWVYIKPIFAGARDFRLSEFWRDAALGLLIFFVCVLSANLFQNHYCP
jgi:hypothetical protein